MEMIEYGISVYSECYRWMIPKMRIHIWKRNAFNELLFTRNYQLVSDNEVVYAIYVVWKYLFLSSTSSTLNYIANLSGKTKSRMKFYTVCSMIYFFSYTYI